MCQTASLWLLFKMHFCYLTLNFLSMPCVLMQYPSWTLAQYFWWVWAICSPFNRLEIPRCDRCDIWPDLDLKHDQTWAPLNFFIRFNSVSESFESTHDWQWLHKTWFKSTHDSKWISEIWFKSTHDSKKFFRILIPINSWLNDAIHSQLRLTFLGHSTLLLTWHDVFWAFYSGVDFVMIFLGAFDSSAFPTNWF